MELENDDPRPSVRTSNFAQQWANADRALGFGFWSQPMPGRFEYRQNRFATHPLVFITAEVPSSPNSGRITVAYGDHAFVSGVALADLDLRDGRDAAVMPEASLLMRRVRDFGRAWRMPELFDAEVLREDVELLQSVFPNAMVDAYLNALPLNFTREQARKAFDVLAEDLGSVPFKVSFDDLGVIPSGITVVFFRAVQLFLEWFDLHDEQVRRLAHPTLQELICHQRRWSISNFGPGARLKGCLDHITKELEEIRAKPGDVSEWADLMILAMDGAWRSGHSAHEIASAVIAKQKKNRDRLWPDWRTRSEDEAIEHIRTGVDGE